MPDQYESYLEMDIVQRKLVQHLLLHEYLQTDEKDETIIEYLKLDLAKYEEAEMYETCQLYQDAIKLFEKQ